jgi:subtilase family serine protease
MTLRRSLLGCALCLGAPLAARAATPAATPLVTGAIDSGVTTPLTASVPAAASLATDQGAMASTASLPHLQVLLKRPAARQAALDALVAQQTTPGSSAYHQWLTPAQLASEYGPASADIAKTVAWLQSKGLTVNAVSPTGMSIDISGTSASVGAAFGTSIHSVMLAGEQHIAPASTPSIPAALSPVVAGVTLSNFFPKPQFQHAVLPSAASVAGGKVTQVGTSYTATFSGATYYAVTPSDFKTIYDETQAFNGSPFFATPITGKGQTIVVAEQTDIKRADWNKFRSTFALSSYAGTLQFTHPGGCADPGMTPDESEAALDAEWSSSVAPDATVIEASCAGTSTTFGVETTLQNLVELGTPAATISISYGGCEQGNGLTFLQGWENLIEEGASEGISIFVSSGDSGVAGCDPAGLGPATAGLAVNGLASNPYDTAVGGTDFQDTALNENSTYWSTTNSSSGGSALSYIPEIPWDNACSNSINVAYVGQTDPVVNCNTVPATAHYQNVVGGGGGKSLYYAKPDWQSTSVTGVPNDGVRDLPDISLFAANGFYNHFYLYCMSDANEGGVPCNYKNATDFLDSAAGGTSFAAPDFAGIAALIAQVKGFKVGNVAPRLYQLAQLQFSMPALVKSCNSSKGNAISAACVFNDVTKGDNSVACQAGTPNCFTNANSTQGIGVSSSTTNKLTTAFPAKQGYSLATGLGTVNVTNLLLNY